MTGLGVHFTSNEGGKTSGPQRSDSFTNCANKLLKTFLASRILIRARRAQRRGPPIYRAQGGRSYAQTGP
jgi:hypothetical protein